MQLLFQDKFDSDVSTGVTKAETENIETESGTSKPITTDESRRPPVGNGVIKKKK